MTNSDNGPVDARTVASQLDATDGVILDMLEKDGRATLSHLSEATGLFRVRRAVARAEA